MYGMVCIFEKEGRDGHNNSLHHRHSFSLNQQQQEEEQRVLILLFILNDVFETTASSYCERLYCISKE